MNVPSKIWVDLLPISETGKDLAFVTSDEKFGADCTSYYHIPDELVERATKWFDSEGELTAVGLMKATVIIGDFLAIIEGKA